MRRSRNLASVLLAGCIATCFAPVSRAQSDNSSLSGVVTDSSGAVVTTAKVTAHSSATGDNRTVVTNAGGNYTLPDVQPGDYSIRVESPGFQSTTLQAVHVDASIGRRVDVSLKIGDASTNVTVEAGVNSVQTESAVVGQLVTQEQVKSIQLNGRNPLYLSQLEPGVVRNAPMASLHLRAGQSH